MGYSTDFNGSFRLNRPATNQEKEYFNRFGDTRRMKRDVAKLMELYHGEHGNPFINVEGHPEYAYGNEGEYFANDDEVSGQTRDKSIIDYNVPPGQIPYNGMDTFDKVWRDNAKRVSDGVCQPGLWCQWRLNDDGIDLEWDGSEKFYNYVEWLKYLINHFFSEWGILLNGEVEWEGEDSRDLGKIIVADNKVTVKIGRITYE